MAMWISVLIVFRMFSETAAGRRVQGGLRASRREEDTGFTKHQVGVERCPSVKSLKTSGREKIIHLNYYMVQNLTCFHLPQFQVHRYKRSQYRAG